ncbi:RyR domain-containing protein [Lysinibacillus sp. RC79]|uniref:RyR domain-containing protein n=1 Tax=Lysinibacillus sp. RC79 TaxID=3156296 RepID=UPI003515A2EC
MNIEQIAIICHNVNKAYCESQGDFTQTIWDIAPDWQKESAINGVEFALESERTPEEMHENWLAQKLEDGWVYGNKKDPELKTHPCIKRYEELPKYQRTKDALFKAVVDSFI